jgi:4-amino-4-deoxy-L-arabinose transferase-like glycosyltransferase
MKRGYRLTGVLLTIGLVCGVVGQFYFAYLREYVWDGALFWGASILVLSVLMWRVVRSERGRTRWAAFVRPLRERPLPALAAIGGVGLSLAAGWRARQRPAAADFSDLFALWLIGVAGFLLAFVPYRHLPADPWNRLQTWARGNRIKLAGLTALTLLALFVRSYDLEHIPANLGGDEGTWAMEGLAMLDGGLANPFTTRWFAFPSMSFLVWGLSTRAFGETVAGVRAVSALIGSGSVLCTFLLGQELWNRRVGWLGAMALAFGHYHLHFSRLAVNNIADSLFVTLALYLLVRGLRSGRSVCFALAGAVMGAGWYGYFGARLVGIIAAVYLAWRMVIEEQFLARFGSRVLVLVMSGMVVAAPQLLNYAANPSIFAEGFDRVSIFASGWLRREQEITGRSASSLLLQQFWKSVSAFHYTLDPTFWYRAEIPLLDSVSGVLMVLGLIWCTARCSWPSNGLLLLWFWSALITGWVITENPPSSQRMVIVTPALAMLVALGLDRLLWFGRHVFDSRRALRHVVVGFLLVAIVGLNLGYYFLYYTPSRVYGNPTAEITTRLARYLSRQDDDYVVYLHGPPFVYWDFGTLRFMARGIAGVDVPPLGDGPAPELDLSRGARFVFHPARVDELKIVRTRYPGGAENHVHSDAGGELLYATYEIEQ